MTTGHCGRGPISSGVPAWAAAPGSTPIFADFVIPGGVGRRCIPVGLAGVALRGGRRCRGLLSRWQPCSHTKAVTKPWWKDRPQHRYEILSLAPWMWCHGPASDLAVPGCLACAFEALSAPLACLYPRSCGGLPSFEDMEVAVVATSDKTQNWGKWWSIVSQEVRPYRIVSQTQKKEKPSLAKCEKRGKRVRSSGLDSTQPHQLSQLPSQRNHARLPYHLRG
jgi:hypothetical protein